MKTQNTAKRVFALVLLLCSLAIIPSSLAHPMPDTIGHKYLDPHTVRIETPWEFANHSQHKRKWSGLYDGVRLYKYEYASHVKGITLNTFATDITEMRNNKPVKFHIVENTYLCPVCNHPYTVKIKSELH